MLAVALTLVLAPCRLDAATTFYVSPAGNDINAGTETQPFKTIQRAANIVNPGDTVIVEDGRYTGTGVGTPCSQQPIVCVHRGGTASAMVTFRARNPLGAKLDGQLNTSTSGFRVVSGARYVRIEGFDIFGIGSTSTSVSAGIELYSGGADSVVTRNEIHDVGRACTDAGTAQVGIFVQQANVTIERNSIHDIGRYAPGEAGCQPGSTSYQTKDHGIMASGQAVSASIQGATDLQISNNVIYHTGRGWAVRLYGGTLANLSILNNTFAFPNPYRDGHILLAASTTNARVTNNVFHKPRAVAISYSPTTQINLQLTENLVSGAGTISALPSGALLVGNQSADPLFQNASTRPYDFHLTATSPAIDMGVALPEAPVDYDGVARGAAFDAGAYEFAQGVKVATAATPVITPNGGTVTGPVTVTLASATRGAAIRYTTDGSLCGSTSPVYTGPFVLSRSATVRAHASATGMNDSAVAQATFTFASAPDTTPPVISGTAAGAITTSGATISWTTNEPADTQVEYGTTTAYGSASPIAASLVTSHSVVLSGLQAGTTYQYRVKSRDAAGNLAVSGTLAFTTTTVPTAKPPASGIWIGKAELDALPASGTNWSEVLATADSTWTVQGIEVQSSHAYHQQAMAGALVYARLAPSTAAEAYRTKVAQAIRNVMAVPTDTSSSVTAPSRNLGAWAIIADLINLPSYDPTLDARFRAWLVAKLDQVYTSSPKTIRLSVQRPNNIGSWSRFAVVACARYLGDTATLQTMAQAMRRWLGDTSVNYTFLWYGDQSWHMTPTANATKVGINPRGATKNGHNFDGMQPEDQNRGTPAGYDSSTFPNDFSQVRYNEVSLAATVGAVLMLHRAGYTDLVNASDQAILRAAKWIKYAADTFPSKGYRYFTDNREGARPLINYLYPSAGLPGTRVRTQFAGREFGYAWTYWTHGR